MKAGAGSPGGGQVDAPAVRAPAGSATRRSYPDGRPAPRAPRQKQPSVAGTTMRLPGRMDSPGWMPHITSSGSVPRLVSRCRLRTLGSPARSSIHRSMRRGVMTPDAQRWTMARSGPSSRMRYAHPCDQNSPRKGSCSPPTTHGCPVGADLVDATGPPVVHVGAEHRWPDVEPRVVVEQVTAGRLVDQLRDAGAVPGQDHTAERGRSPAPAPETPDTTRHR